MCVKKLSLGQFRWFEVYQDFVNYVNHDKVEI